jgi:hypothetical protein
MASAVESSQVVRLIVRLVVRSLGFRAIIDTSKFVARKFTMTAFTDRFKA